MSILRTTLPFLALLALATTTACGGGEGSATASTATAAGGTLADRAPAAGARGGAATATKRGAAGAKRGGAAAKPTGGAGKQAAAKPAATVGPGLVWKNGWELVTWQAEGEEQFRFSLLPVTSVPKVAKDVFSTQRGDGRYSIRGQGAKQLAGALARLGSGEKVVWNPESTPAPPEGVELVLPEEAVLSRMLEATRSQGVEIESPG